MIYYLYYLLYDIICKISRRYTNNCIDPALKRILLPLKVNVLCYIICFSKKRVSLYFFYKYDILFMLYCIRYIINSRRYTHKL